MTLAELEALRHALSGWRMHLYARVGRRCEFGELLMRHGAVLRAALDGVDCCSPLRSDAARAADPL